VSCVDLPVASTGSLRMYRRARKNTFQSTEHFILCRHVEGIYMRMKVILVKGSCSFVFCFFYLSEVTCLWQKRKDANIVPRPWKQCDMCCVRSFLAKRKKKCDINECRVSSCQSLSVVMYCEHGDKDSLASLPLPTNLAIIFLKNIH